MNYRIATFADDLVDCVARTVIDDSKARGHLPDLSWATVILPPSVSKITPQRTEFHRVLLEYAKQQGAGALIPPQIITLQGLFQHHYTPRPTPPMDRRTEQLILASALYENRNLFADKNVWRLSDHLIDLFNEISERYFDTSDTNRIIQEKLQDLDDDIWSEDSKKILAVWKEWSALSQENTSLIDEERKAFQEEDLIMEDEHIYLCGIEYLTDDKIHWASRLYQQEQLTFFSQDDSRTVHYASPVRKIATGICGEEIKPPTADTPLSRFVAEVFSDMPNKKPFAQRAKDFATELESPLQGRLSIFSADSFEQHSWGIYWAIKRWIERDYQRISLVCLDRKLARRLRAIFDRYGLVLQDYSGWELSTTSSATIIVSLLPDEKKPFECDTLIDLLRSPFCHHGISRRDAIYVTEMLQRHLSKLDYLPPNLPALLDTISDSQPFKPIVVKLVGILQSLQSIDLSSNRPLSEYFDTLFTTLTQLNIDKRLATDNAGKMLLRELQRMNDIARQKNIAGDSYFWRGWIMHTLEQRNFLRPVPQRGILLLNLQQARLWRSDAVILAGLEENALPKAREHLLNENIRKDIGLTTRQEQTALQFYLFRRLIESSDKMILTHQRYDSGHFVPPSPWLEAIQSFHRVAYADDLTDTTLNQYADICQDQAIKHNVVNPPCIPQRPSFRSAKTLWPEHFSANAHKSIINCPYQFFVKYCLKLYSERLPERYLTNLTFGSHLHKILEQLHTQADKEWNIKNKPYLLDVANQIIAERFDQAVADNYINVHWRKQAQEIVRNYIDWVIDFSSEHQNVKFSHEVDETLDISERLSLRGKIDCYIQSDDTHLLIDYKTGSLPAKKDIENGEDVQLACYTLLKPQAQEAYYLSLKDNNTGSFKKRSLSKYSIDEYRDKAQARLEAIYTRYANGSELPAWGNERSACQWCEYGGLCRRTIWKDLQNQ